MPPKKKKLADPSSKTWPNSKAPAKRGAALGVTGPDKPKGPPFPPKKPGAEEKKPVPPKPAAKKPAPKKKK